jgi:hypothetical protein
MMSEGEYSTFPYSISRYSTSPEEVFGRGPAMQALADVKRLNKISESVLKAVDKILDPTLLAKDNFI